jgi:hypothetical protein
MTLNNLDIIIPGREAHDVTHDVSRFYMNNVDHVTLSLFS